MAYAPSAPPQSAPTDPALVTAVQQLGSQLTELSAVMGNMASAVDQLNARVVQLEQPRMADPVPDPIAHLPILQEVPAPSVNIVRSLKVPQLPVYKGGEKELQSWLERASTLLPAAGLSLRDTSAVQQAILHLDEKALRWWRNRTEEHGLDGGCTCWADFELAISDRFGPANPDVVGRYHLFGLRQLAPGLKSLNKYVELFQQHSATLRTPMQDLDMRELFLHGMDVELVLEVRTAHKDKPFFTFQDALNMAVQIATTKSYHLSLGGKGASAKPGTGGGKGRGNGYAGAPSSHNAGKGGNGNGHNNGPVPMDLGLLNNLCVEAGLCTPAQFSKLSAEQVARYYKEGRCFNCGETGHKASACPKSRTGK